MENYTSYSSCLCFQNLSSLRSRKIPAKNISYIQQEKELCNSIFNEIQKHQFFDIENMKPCYGITTIQSSFLRESFFRHQKTILRLTTLIKKTQPQFDITFENGKTISVGLYTQTLKDIIKSKIKTVENFTDYSTPVCLQTLKESERNHLNTLIVIENVINSSSNGNDQLELYLESPI